MKKQHTERPLKNWDVNWLYFNERVLLEADNKNVPLLERLKFLAIFSSNLDEYFKVRISKLWQLKNVDKKLRKKLVLKPNKKLKFILKTCKTTRTFWKYHTTQYREGQLCTDHIQRSQAKGELERQYRQTERNVA